MKKISLLLVCVVTASAWGAKEGEVGSAILSPSGVKRIQDNIKTLEQNIKDATNNIQICDKNLKVLQGEIELLAGLEKEHYELKQKLNDYLDNAQKFYSKNAQEVQKLAKSIKEMEAAPRGQGESAQRERVLDKLRQDDSDLARWKSDADQKVKRIKDMIHEVNSDLTDLAGRKNTVKADVSSWNQRKNEYEKLLVDYKRKKGDAELLVKNSNQANRN